MDMDSSSAVMIKDAGFDLTPASLYQLIISLGKTSIEAAVFDAAKKKFVAFQQNNIHNTITKQEYFDAVKEVVSKSELLRLPYKSSSLLWQSQCVTLVPMPLYEVEERKTYLKFNQNSEPDDIILSDKLLSADSYNIFSVPSGLTSVFSIADLKIHHHSSVFIESLISLNKHNINPLQVYVNIRSGFFDLLVINNRKLHFFNSFAYTSSEDFIYFLLFSFEQLKIMPENTPVTLSGYIQKDSAIYDIMYKYVRHLDFLQAVNQVADSYILQEVAAYQYHDLFSYILCEL